MPYNPSVQDRTADYIMRGAENASQSIAGGITSAATALAGGIGQYQQTKQERERMGGMLEQIGAFNDPKFAEDFAKAPYGKQQAMFAKGMMDYMKTQEMQQDMQKMQRKQQLMAYEQQLRESAAGIPQEELPEVQDLLQHYMTRAGNGLQPTSDFMSRVFRLSGKAQKGFFSGVGSAMSLLDATRPKEVAQPQFQPAPGGGQVMVNPNTGQAQYIPPPKANTPPSYGTIPAPAPGTVGLLDTGDGVRVIPAPSAQQATNPYSDTMGLPEATGPEADARLRAMNSLFEE